MNKAIHIDPPSQNVADMLAILANPDQYRMHLAELQTKHKELTEALGLYNSLEKVNAYRQEVTVQAAEAAKSRDEANKLWGKLEQSSQDLALRKQELDEYKASLDERHSDNIKALDRASQALQSAQADHDQAVALLDTAKAKLKADQLRHDGRVAQYKEKLDLLRKAMQDVLAL